MSTKEAITMEIAIIASAAVGFIFYRNLPTSDEQFDPWDFVASVFWPITMFALVLFQAYEIITGGKK